MRLPEPIIRRRVNLLVEAKLLDQARELELNISDVVEKLLRAHLKEMRREHWLRTSGRSIASYNHHIATIGVLSQRFLPVKRPPAPRKYAWKK